MEIALVALTVAMLAAALLARWGLRKGRANPEVKKRTRLRRDMPRDRRHQWKTSRY